MKFKAPVSLNLLSPKSLLHPEEFKGAVQAYCEFFQDLVPEKWGWWEPLDQVFDANNLDQLLPKVGGDCVTVYWKRNKQPKAEGSFTVRWQSKTPSLQNTHSSVNLTVEMAQLRQNETVSCLKALSKKLNAHFCIMDSLTESYRKYAFASNSITSDRFYIVSHVIRHWLPDVYWGTVFGPPYVELFGRDRLLSAPAWIVEEIEENMIYMQMTENIIDVIESPSTIENCRSAIKKHLVVDAFFDPGRSYDRRKRGATGDVFAVPTFSLE